MYFKMEDSELIKDFDDILPYIGGWGAYQIRLFLSLLPLYVFFSYSIFNPILFLYEPDHWCTPDQQVSHLDLDLLIPMEVGKRSRCLMYDIRNEEVKKL